MLGFDPTYALSCVAEHAFACLTLGLNPRHQFSFAPSSRGFRAAFSDVSFISRGESTMRRYLSVFLIALAVLGGTLAQTGCVVVAPRPARVWVPGYWGAGHVWVGGYWRYH
jgi:hypothetical protein